MKGIFYMIVAALCLGTIGVMVKLIGTEVHYMTLNFYRVFLAFIFLICTVPFFDKSAFNLTRKESAEYFMVGLLLAIALSLYTTANLFAPVQNVVLINYIYPFFVLIMAYFFLGEKITNTKIATLFIALCGLIIINPFQSGLYTFGNSLALFGALFYAILITEMRKENRDHTIGDVIWFFFFAAVLLSPSPLLFGFGNLGAVWPYLLILGIIGSGLAYLMFNLALETLEAEVASIIATIITPITSIILAVVVIEELLQMRVIIGGILLIIAGVYLETHNREVKKATN
ncbi:DMT family transporter [Candidatus Altiarchaeota archaeon]